MLLSTTLLKQITDVGVTCKGSIYLTYITEKGKGCSFVSFSELRTALNIDGVNSRILAEVARDRIPALLAYNHSHFPLNNHIEQQAAEIAPEYLFLQRQIEKAVAELNLTAQFLEEDGELFARIYADKFLGIINIDAFGKLTVFSSRWKGKRVFSVAGAMTLVTQELPKKRMTDEEFAALDAKRHRGGAYLDADGTVQIDHHFYRLMGKASQIRGRRANYR